MNRPGARPSSVTRESPRTPEAATHGHPQEPGLALPDLIRSIRISASERQGPEDGGLAHVLDPLDPNIAVAGGRPRLDLEGDTGVVRVALGAEVLQQHVCVRISPILEAPNKRLAGSVQR